MSQVFSSGIFPYADGAPHIVNDVSAVSIGYFVNRTPLVSRLNRVPVGSVTFRIVGRQPRQRTTRLSAAIADNTNTTVPVTNASLFMLGDVLQRNRLRDGGRENFAGEMDRRIADLLRDGLGEADLDAVTLQGTHNPQGDGG